LPENQSDNVIQSASKRSQSDCLASDNCVAEKRAVKFSIRSLVWVLAACGLAIFFSPITTANIVGPTGPPVIIEDPLRSSATFTFSDDSEISANSANGHFRLVGLHLNEVIDVTVLFPAGWENASLAIQPLDGGILTSPANTSIAEDGTASLRFQAGNLPGLYRIALISAGGHSILQFWVNDPGNQQVDPPVQNPGH
jgi:hypothetical protein